MNLLTTVHNNGIVNQYQIVSECDDLENDTLVQIVWNNKFQGYILGLNPSPQKLQGSIKKYRAAYLNGVMIVKDGEVYPRKKRFGLF